jgi:hypothetical protein
MSDQIRVFRIVEYVGSREAVERTLRASIHGTKHVSNGLRITAVTLHEFPEMLGLLRGAGLPTRAPQREAAPDELELPPPPVSQFDDARAAVVAWMRQKLAAARAKGDTELAAALERDLAGRLSLADHLVEGWTERVPQPGDDDYFYENDPAARCPSCKEIHKPFCKPDLTRYEARAEAAKVLGDGVWVAMELDADEPCTIGCYPNVSPPLSRGKTWREALAKLPVTVEPTKTRDDEPTGR